MQCNAGFGNSMPPLPDVYGTSGKIEPLLDASLINRFADLPQDGELNYRMPWPFCACQNGLSDASRSGCSCAEPLRLWWPPWLLRPQGPIAVPAKRVSRCLRMSAADRLAKSGGTHGTAATPVTFRAGSCWL